MYSRFKALESFGEEELERVQNSTVAVVGLGATGSVMAEHMARHGANLILVDRDYLEPNDCYSSNLYETSECERRLPKAEVAARKLEDFTEVKSHTKSINPENVSILDDAELILDGTDNMETRFLLNDYSKKNNTPWIYTAALGRKGYSMFFDQKCFNCVFEQVSTGTVGTCETEGILRETSTIAASVSAKKAVKKLAGNSPAEKLYAIHLNEEFDVESEGCDVCESEEYPHLEAGKKVSSVCGERKYEIRRDITEKAIENIRQIGSEIEENKYLVRAEIDGREFVAFKSGRVILEAEDEDHAEQIFAEVVGV